MANPSVLILFQNGMVAAFDADGEQMPQYQGRAADVAVKLQGVDISQCECSLAVYPVSQTFVTPSFFIEGLAEYVAIAEAQPNGN